MKDKKVKLLLVTPYFPPHSGGLENYAFNIAQGLMQTHKYEVFVVTSNSNDKRQIIEEYCGIKVYRLPVMLRFANTPINPLWYLAIRKIIRAEKPDIINSHQPVPFIGDLTASLTGNIPFVLTYHSGAMRKNKLLPDIIIFLYETFILPHTAKKATKIICVSNFVRDSILKNYASKSTIIHPGVDVSLFKPDSLIEKENKLILFICHSKSMHKIKGLYYLLEALKLLPEVKLHIIGEKGDFTDKRFISVGIKRGKNLVEEMQRASVVVLPSIAIESFGMVLIEALACQTPVVGTKIGGIPEVIRDGIDGFLVPAQDSNALALAISKIMVDKELATRMGCSGAARVRENFTWDTRVDLTKEVFESCLK
ncbi:MAG TPA: glycosyltransferase family 4 protein [Ktedonobacteraceae bacterium]|jgi:glycosyltransferase involved in cell wall biosynthesis